MFTRSKAQSALPPPPESTVKPDTQPSIHELSFAELKAFHAHIGELLAEKEAQARLDFKRDFIDRMTELGLTLDDLKQSKERKERKPRDFPIKYRDPDNPANVWTGIGKPKKWLQEKLDQGHSLEEFLVCAPAEPAGALS